MRARLLAVLAAAAVAGVAPGALAGGPPLPRVETVAIDPDTLPVVEIPEIANATPPKICPKGPPPADLEVRTASGKPLKHFHPGGAPLEVEIIGATGMHVGLVAGRISPSPHGVDLRSSIPVTCTRSAQPLALRWERFATDPAATTATVEIASGWFDLTACRAVAVTRTTVHPVLIARYSDLPILFAARAEHALALFLPHGSRFVEDANGGEASMMTGEVPRVILPVVKGGSASFTGAVELGALETWRARIEGKTDPPPSSDANVSVRFGVDVLQPVREDRPSVLVRIETGAANAVPQRSEPMRNPAGEPDAVEGMTLE